jgi:hypothetical protein
MSDLTDDQVRALLDGNELRSDSQSHTVWLLARALLQARADAAAAVALAYEAAAEFVGNEAPSFPDNVAWCVEDLAKAVRALAPAEGIAELAKLRERAEKAEQERVAEWNRRRDADGSRDAARAACDTMRAERDTLTAELAELRALCNDKGGPGGVQTSTGPMQQMEPATCRKQYAKSASKATLPISR